MDEVLKFKRKITKRFCIYYVICIILLIGFLVMLYMQKGWSSILPIIVVCIIIAVFNIPISKYYVINPEIASLRCGNINGEININSIQSLKVLNESIEIDHEKNLRKTKTYVTPEDIDGFIKALQEINGNITIGKINK